MFLRRSRRRYKGETYEYWSLVETVRTEHDAADPAEDAARNLDWAQFLEDHPPRYRVAVEVLAGGGTMRDAGRLLGICDSPACTLRRRIASDLVEFFGPDVIARLLAGIRPNWENDVRAGRERHLHCAVTRDGEMAVPA